MEKDILFDEKGDLKIVDGDFVIADADNQVIEALMVSVKGELKEFPLVGADISRLLKSRDGQTRALKEIKAQLKSDGFDVANIKIAGNDIQVNATRTI